MTTIYRSFVGDWNGKLGLLLTLWLSVPCSLLSVRVRVPKSLGTLGKLCEEVHSFSTFLFSRCSWLELV